MPIFANEAIPRKTCAIIFVVETSAAMAEPLIGAVNSAIEESLQIFREMNEDNCDAELEVAFLTFSDGARWLTPNGPIKIYDYHWNDLEPSGRADFGAACKMLSDKLDRRSRFFRRYWSNYVPIIFLISSQPSTDDYKQELEELKHNELFRQSLKFALPVGDNADESMLEDFTGSIEAVLRISYALDLEKCIRLVHFEPVGRCIPDSTVVQSSFYHEVHSAIPDDNVLWNALQSTRSECSEDIFSNPSKFKSVLADFLVGARQDVVRIRKRTVEAVELGIYKRLKDAELSDLERVARVEIKRLCDEGINEATAREIVYAFAKFFVQSDNKWFVEALPPEFHDDDQDDWW